MVEMVVLGSGLVICLFQWCRFFFVWECDLIEDFVRFVQEVKLILESDCFGSGRKRKMVCI